MDANRTDWYIRHSSYYLQVESENLTDNLPLFQGDSSYILHVDTFYTGYYALESVSLPGHYIKSEVNDRLMVTQRSYTADYYDTASFRILDYNSSSMYDRSGPISTQSVYC